MRDTLYLLTDVYSLTLGLNLHKSPLSRAQGVPCTGTLSHRLKGGAE